MVRRLGAPRSLKIATTATGSVAETIAPSSRQATNPTPEIASMAKPTAKVEINRPTTASIRIGFMSFIKWRTLMLMADSKISAGRKRKNTASEVMSRFSMACRKSPAIPALLLSGMTSTRTPSTTPAAASNTVKGKFRRRATGCKRLAISSRTNKPSTTRKRCKSTDTLPGPGNSSNSMPFHTCQRAAQRVCFS